MFGDYEAILDAGCEAWNKLLAQPETIKSSGMRDWTARFFGEVQDVSSEEMQTLWGSVLAGEVREPGATSMRTLGILKDLDATTARLFSRLCSVAVYLKRQDGEIFDARVPSLGGNAAHNSLEKYGLGFGALNRLNEHGLIIADYNSYSKYVVVNDDTEEAGELELHHQGVCWDWVIEQEEVKKSTVKLYGVAMTVAEYELSRVVSHEPMAEYTEALGSILNSVYLAWPIRVSDTVTC